MTVNSPEQGQDQSERLEFAQQLSATADRRRRNRVPLQLRVRLYSGEQDEPVVGTTRNISSDGFYCVTSKSFGLGQWLDCAIEYPAYDAREPDRKLLMACKVIVVRTVAEETPACYGVACRIENFECRFLDSSRPSAKLAVK